MKKIVTLGFLFVVLGSYAQTTTKNYVKETIRRYPSVGSFPIIGGTNEHVVTTTYYDGLGRPVQIVDQNSSPDDNKNIVTHIEYEKNIGQTKEYLPFLSTGYTTSGGRFPVTTYNSDLVNDAQTKAFDFYDTFDYQDTNNPYSESIKEASPRQRILEIGFPGADWKASLPNKWKENGWDEILWNESYPQEKRNTIRSFYSLNAANEVKHYKVTTNFGEGIYHNTVSENGFYPINTLTKTIVKNENWKDGDGTNNTVEEFKDPKGNVVLKRNYNNSEAHDTYYVYNDLDLLAFVIPPMANGSVLGDHLDTWCYQYNYDVKKRLVEKKLPQKEWEYIVYDKADRVVMTGPVHSPFGDSDKGWLITKYDAFGRSVYTGYYTANTFSSAERNSLAQNNFTVESKTTSNTTIDGITTRYSNNSFPTNFKLLSVNYYDDYNYPNAPTAFPTIESETVNTAVKGQITGTWMRTLTTASSTAGITSYNLYDDKYRVLRSYSTNHLGGYIQVDSKLSFTGVATKTITYQKQNASATVLTITDNFTYDRRDRLTKQTQQIGNGTIETVVANEYDALGVLVTKNVGGATGNLQKVAYKYNIRGWLTDINTVYYLGSPNQTDGLFSYKINYNNIFKGDNSKPQYNGNISSVGWRTQSDNIMRGYGFDYDYLNRLNYTSHLKALVNSYEWWWTSYLRDGQYAEALTYDKNGNITTLKRFGQEELGQPIEIDDLTYTYNANQLQSVTDATNNPEGFNDGNTTGNDYEYDTFGNITKDLNKGISSVTYNHLNLPYNVNFSNGGKITYIYDAAGMRLSKKVTPIGGLAVTTDYLSGFEYENGILQTFPHAEGYVENKFIGSGNRGIYKYVYHYIYKDHLGNNRLIYADLDGDGTINPATEIVEENNYYPFGLKHKGYNELPGKGYKYKYAGKELNSELGLDLYDFGARNYDPALGRWLNVDPKAEEMRRFSPYVYAFNNPIYFTDPDGMKPEDWYIDWNSGRVLGQDGAETNNVRIIKANDWGRVNRTFNTTESAEATDDLQSSSSLITFDNETINSNINTINNETITDQSVERQVFFMLQRSENDEGMPFGKVTSVIGAKGTTANAKIPATNGYVNDNLMLGQIHSHNKNIIKGRENAPGASETDHSASIERNFNIYSIDSYKGLQEGGNQIYMTNPKIAAPPGKFIGTTTNTNMIGRQVLIDFINLNK